MYRKFKIEAVEENSKRGRTKCNFTYQGKTVFYNLPSGLFKKLKEISEGIEISGSVETILKSDDFKKEVYQILKEQSKIFAIKFVRGKTGLGLQEGLSYVNSIETEFGGK